MQLINHSKIILEYWDADDTTLGSTYIKTEDGRIWKNLFLVQIIVAHLVED